MSDLHISPIIINKSWNDLKLPDETSKHLEHIKEWLKQKLALRNENSEKKLRSGYKSLFYGPPGTWKTLTAGVLAKEFGFDVYRIDLSEVVSKYIGETEKNLEMIFERAEEKNAILFF